ncbi:ATP-dependent Lon protease pim1 [Entomortierella lignicola]|nr:ATP-dependent Lon protease pim1 [Entomortierella lignicola]
MAPQRQQHRNVVSIPQNVYKRLAGDMPGRRIPRSCDPVAIIRRADRKMSCPNPFGYSQHCATMSESSLNKRKLPFLPENELRPQSSEKKRRMDAVQDPEPLSSSSSRPPREIISISSDNEVGVIPAKTKQAAEAIPSKAEPLLEAPHKQEQEVIVISPDNDAHTGPEQAGPATASTKKDGHKFQVLPKFQAIVDKVLPVTDLKNRAVLERAYATSTYFRETYVVLRYLGNGGSGLVLAAKRVCDWREVAIKLIPQTKPAVMENVILEIRVMSSLAEHDNVIPILDFFSSSLDVDTDVIDPSGATSTDIMYIVTEMGGISLLDFVDLHKPSQMQGFNTVSRTQGTRLLPQSSIRSPYNSSIQEVHLRSIFKQISLGLHSLHAQSFVHGDMKDENTLISVDHAAKTYRARICDFGHSRQALPTSPVYYFYGTTILSPPEMDRNIQIVDALKKRGRPIQELLQHNPDLFSGYEADVWALGLSLFSLIHGSLPSEIFETDKTLVARYKANRSSKQMFPFALQANLDPELQHLLENMLAVDPAKRLTMDEVIHHPWVVREP